LSGYTVLTAGLLRKKLLKNIRTENYNEDKG